MGDKYAIHHNLPFLNIFSTEGLRDVWNYPNVGRLQLGELDIRRLKKTRVDLTLCDL